MNPSASIEPFSQVEPPRQTVELLQPSRVPLGAHYLGKGLCSFCVWAPHAQRVELCIVEPEQRCAPLHQDGGYFVGLIEGVYPGARYYFRLNDGELRPDPSSRFQPDGIHGPSEVLNPDFNWQDLSWFGRPLSDYVLYELHVGTFTREGTFEAVIPHLAELRDLGITAIEIMPVAQFPGGRNWGYDGVYPFAVQNTYGGPVGLKRLVDACHQHQIAVVLDVVYNHIGPEGNYLREFGPYFNAAYRTPWGEALNFDGAESDHVRRFFLENALYWQTEFHIDALRLDAVHAIRDFSATPFLQDLAERTHARAEQMNRRFYLIAESDLNDARLLRPPALGGYGLDSQWTDDFHHSLHVLLTGERNGYYEDFGGVKQLARIYRQGWAYAGEYSRHRRRRHGNATDHTSSRQFIVCAQNHDQIGNRFLGERLTALVSFEQLKLAAGAVLLSPFLPMLFMGEEYGEPAPFQYFISHTDPDLVEAVRKGRRDEFAAFKFNGEVPDPFAPETFNRSVLDHTLPVRNQKHRKLREFYREVIHLRKRLLLGRGEALSVQACSHGENGLQLRYFEGADAVCVFMNFSATRQTYEIESESDKWLPAFDSAAPQWNGPGNSTIRPESRTGKIILNLQPASFIVLRADMTAMPEL